MRSRSSCLAALVCALLAALPLQATTYVPMTDETLVDHAPLIALVKVQGAEATHDPRGPATFYSVRVQRALKGKLPAPDAVVRVPGGVGADGRRLRIEGAPSFAPGERAVLFLSPRSDGTYGVYQLFLGAFHEVSAGGRRLAVRHLDGRAVLPAGKAAAREPVRDFDRFADWIEARARGIRSLQGYEVAESRNPGLAVESFRFLAVDNRVLRWFEFNEGESISWRAHEDGLPGVTGGGFAEFQTALAAWNDDPGSAINYVYAGTTASAGGFSYPDGVNGLLFEDPNGDIGSPFQCADGGILAIGGSWYDLAPAVFGGLTYLPHLEGDIITNQNVGCYLADPSPPSEAAEELFAHELGHTLGLSHSNDANALMWPYIHGDGRGARLEDDERQAAAFLYREELPFYTLPPCRLLDTRSDGGPLAPGEQRYVPTGGLCGIPPGARALSANVTAVTPSGAGHLILFPWGETVPETSTVNFRPGTTRANNAILTLSAQTRAFALRAEMPGGGLVHVVVDVNGYFE